MPVLPSEPCLYPDDLLEELAQSQSAERVWWVLHSRPRQEKSLARQLLEKRLPFYLPVNPRRSHIRGRAMTSHVPLFPGYVFLHGTGDERVSALTTSRVVRVLEVFDQQRLWQDLKQVHRLLASGAAVRPEERLLPGVRVVISSGPLAGMSGKIIRSASGRRFMVEVDFIQVGASVELDESTLDAVVPAAGIG